LAVNHTDTVTPNLTYQVESEKKLKSVWFRLLFGQFITAQWLPANFIFLLIASSAVCLFLKMAIQHCAASIPQM